jgi:hypothetical protein
VAEAVVRPVASCHSIDISLRYVATMYQAHFLRAARLVPATHGGLGDPDSRSKV